MPHFQICRIITSSTKVNFNLPHLSELVSALSLKNPNKNDKYKAVGGVVLWAP